jgi:hypothetical protein
MKEKKQLTAPAWVVKEFEARRQRAHEVNITTLRKSIRRRERIREALAFGGAFLALGGVGNIETTDFNVVAITIITAGLLMTFVSSLMLRGGENE